MNTSLAPPVPTPLGGFSLLSLQGPDALAFAQAQFCNDVLALADGQWQWNGWLTPKGRVVALFALLRLDPARVWLVLPDFDARALAEPLRRYVFRSKLAIEPLDGYRACAVPLPEGGFQAPERARIDGDRITLDFGTQQRPRALGILPAADVPGPPDPALDMAWRHFDLEHGLSRIDPDTDQAWTPQMLSLDRLRAYSVKKGCYPGQEIVARTHFLGQAKRGLVQVLADAPLRPGATVVDHEGRTLGPLVCVASDDRACRALAILPLASPATQDGWQVAGEPVRVSPIGDGLSR